MSERKCCNCGAGSSKIVTSQKEKGMLLITQEFRCSECDYTWSLTTSKKKAKADN